MKVSANSAVNICYATVNNDEYGGACKTNYTYSESESVEIMGIN
jgi:hypothetical protein